MDILQQLSNNPYITLSGWAATVIALVLAIFFYFSQKRRKIISYSYQTNRIVSDKLSEVEGLNVIYNGDVIEKLSITNIEITNNGNAIIEERDFYDKKKLKIVTDDKKIKLLFAKITYQSSETIECSVKIQDSEICVNFQALEIKENAIITIYHTGDAKTNFKLEGKIKDGGKIRDRGKIAENEDAVWQKMRFLYIAMCLTMFMTLVCFFVIFEKEKKIAELTGITSVMLDEKEKLSDKNEQLEGYVKAAEKTISLLEQEMQNYEKKLSEYDERLQDLADRLSTFVGNKN